MTPVALTIAGSDSGGGAGIQADVRVFHRLGVFGTTAVTAVTAQNLSGITGVVGVPVDMVREQVTAVLDGFSIRAIKTGMLWSRDIVDAVAELSSAHRELPVVVDPVMVATTGARLLDHAAVTSYCERLLPEAALITPNLDEAAVLLGRDRPIKAEDMAGVADDLYRRFGCPVLLKGGHAAGDPIDHLRTRHDAMSWTHRRILKVATHGTGCMLSAAIAGHLALGQALTAAVENSLAFVHDALVCACRLSADVALGGIEAARANTDHLHRRPVQDRHPLT